MPRKIRDAKIQNGRYDRQTRLFEKVKEFVEKEPLISKVTIETQPDCFNVGPQSPYYGDDCFHQEDIEWENDFFEYGCKNCSFENDCKWAKQFSNEERSEEA